MFDLLITNGRIYTLAKEGEYAASVGIKDGKIAFIGTNEEAEGLMAKRCINLQGKTVIPGMGDSHMHFYAYCQTLTQVDLGSCKSKKEMMERMKKAAGETPAGQWIRGANFDQSKWEDTEDELPTRYDLDSVSEEHPIMIKRVCLHTSVVNTYALRLAGIDKECSDETSGINERNADGMPDGILREQLSKRIEEMIPDPLADVRLKKEIMAKELQRMASQGMTVMHTYAAEVWKYVEDAETYRDLDENHLLPLRVYIYSDQLETLENSSGNTDTERDNPFHKVKMGGYKMFCDGSLGSRSAALFAPYSDDIANRGIVVEDLQVLKNRMYRAASQGIQCAVHAIGDRAMDIVLSAIESTIERMKADGATEAEIKRNPFRLIHAQMSTDELVERMKKLPLIVDVQPSFAVSDFHWAKERLGEARLRRAYPWKTYINSGLLLTGGSDSPVEDFNPLTGIYNCLVHPNASERISRYEAVCLFSRNIAWATGDQTRMGTIEIGKFADLVVLDQDIFQIPVSEIPETKIERTLLAGKETWVSPGTGND